MSRQIFFLLLTLYVPLCADEVTEQYFLLPSLSTAEQLRIAQHIMRAPLGETTDSSTQTMLGRIVFAHNKTDVQAQEAAVTFLLSHPHLTNQLHHLLAAFAEHEMALLSLWNDRDLLFGKNVEKAFYKNDMSLPHTADSLEQERLKDDILLVVSPFAYYGLSTLLCHLVGATASTRLQAVLKSLLTGLMLVSDGRRQLTRLFNRVAIVQHLRTRLSPLVRCARIATIAGNLMRTTPVCAALRDQLVPLKTLTSATPAHEMFFENLQSTSFTSTRYCTRIGPVLAALPQFLRLRHTFTPALHAIGMLDVYVSLARTHKSQQEMRLQR